MALFDPELGEKIANLISEHTTGIVTGCYTICEYISGEDGDQRVFFAVSPGQKATTTAGLLTLADDINRYELSRYVGEMYSTDNGDQ